MIVTAKERVVGANSCPDTTSANPLEARACSPVRTSRTCIRGTERASKNKTANSHINCREGVKDRQRA